MPPPFSTRVTYVDKVLEWLAGFFVVIGGIALISLVALTIVAVVWRYFLNDPISGTEELSTILLTIVAGASVAYGARHNSHVSIDLISRIFGAKVTRYTNPVMRAVVVFTGVLATYALFAKACGPEKACITANFNISHRPFYYALGVAMGYLTLEAIFQFWRNIRGHSFPAADDDSDKVAK